MSDHVFADAFARVRARHSDTSWLNLSAREISSAIYAEIRTIDRERLTPADGFIGPVLAIAAE